MSTLTQGRLRRVFDPDDWLELQNGWCLHCEAPDSKVIKLKNTNRYHCLTCKTEFKYVRSQFTKEVI